MTREDAIRKIVAAYQLAIDQAGTPEANASRIAADRLRDRFEISEHEIGSKGEDKRVSDGFLECPKAQWSRMIVSSLARFCGVHPVVNTGKGGGSYLFGRALDIELFEYFYHCVEAQRVVAFEFYKRFARNRTGKKMKAGEWRQHLRQWNDSFAYGFRDKIHGLMVEAVESTDGCESLIFVGRHSVAKKHAHSRMKTGKIGCQVGLHQMHGASSGENVNLSKGIGEGGQRNLLTGK